MEADAPASDVNDALCPRQVGASHAVAEIMSYALITNSSTAQPQPQSGVEKRNVTGPGGLGHMHTCMSPSPVSHTFGNPMSCLLTTDGSAAQAQPQPGVDDGNEPGP